MYVNLSHQAWTSVSRRIPELHRERMKEHRVPAGRRQHKYELPAIAWRQILDLMLKDAYGERGGQIKENPQSFYTALKRIQTAVSWREHHPALTRGAMMGRSTEFMLVWRSDGKLSPYPSSCMRDVYGGCGERPLVLVPMVQDVNGHVVTEWFEGSLLDWQFGYSLDPLSHWEFFTDPART